MADEGMYELRYMVTDPISPAPAIEVIIVTGKHKTIQRTREQFAKDFEFLYLSIPDYLRTLLHSDSHCHDALGVLHPDALGEMLSTCQPIPTFFLISILLHKINGLVTDGCSRFLIVGLDEDMKTTSRFAEKVSMIQAPLVTCD